jgi:hypothetical protein
VFLNNRNAARKNNRALRLAEYNFRRWLRLVENKGERGESKTAVGYTRCLKARRKSGAIMLMSRHIVVCNTTSFVAFSP